MAASPPTGTRLLAQVLPLAYLQIVAWGTLYFSFTLFIEPIRQDLHSSRSAIAAGISLGLAVSAAVQLRIGKLIGRLGAHGTMAAGSLLGACALLLLSASHTLAGYYLAWAALGVTVALCFFEPAFAALFERLPDRFATAVSLLVMLSGLASVVFLPLTDGLLRHLGWRDTLRVFAVMHLASAALALALRVLGKRQAPRRDSLRIPSEADRHAAPEEIKDPRFWCLASGFALNTYVVTALAIHLLGVLAAKGFPPGMALAAAAGLGPAQMLGRLAQALLARHISFRAITVTAFAAFLAGIVALQISCPPGILIWLAIALIGISGGMMAILRGTLVAVLYEPDIYASMAGALAAPSSLARAAAPLGAALIVETAAGYGKLAWLLDFCTALALAAVSSALLAYDKKTVPASQSRVPDC